MPRKKHDKNPEVKISDKELCKMISKSIAQVIRFSHNEDFRDKSFKVLHVSSTKEAEEQINLRLASIINNDSSLGKKKTKNQNKISSTVNANESLDVMNLLHPNHEFTDCTRFEEVSEGYDVSKQNQLCNNRCDVNVDNTRNQTETLLSAESVQDTFMNLFYCNYEVSEATTFKEVSRNFNLVNENLDNGQIGEILESQNLLAVSNEQSSTLQAVSGQAIPMSENDKNTGSEALNYEDENVLGNHSEPMLLSESQQSSNSQASSLSQEIFEKDWLEISSKKRLLKNFERGRHNLNYFQCNSHNMLNSGDGSSIDQYVSSSSSQEFLEGEFFSSSNGSKFEKALKRNRQNFLEANMKRQKTQNLKFNLMDLSDTNLQYF